MYVDIVISNVFNLNKHFFLLFPVYFISSTLLENISSFKVQLIGVTRVGRVKR